MDYLGQVTVSYASTSCNNPYKSTAMREVVVIAEVRKPDGSPTKDEYCLNGVILQDRKIRRR